MSCFLNRQAIVDKIGDIIDTAKREIIMVIPYIKLSETTYQKLLAANSKGVEIIIIYREDQVGNMERTKLKSLSNLTLLCHPEIHAKCYLNEEEMVITSMNLYAYSEKYNREMGILLSNKSYGDERTYKEALTEVRDIIQTARLEKKSSLTQELGFKSEILRPKWQKLIPSAKKVNRYFDNKVFDAVDDGGSGTLKCLNYYENIDAFIEPDFSCEVDDDTGHFTPRRMCLDFKWEESKRKELNKIFLARNPELMFPGFKVYWDYYGKRLTIYRDQYGFPAWQTYDFEKTILEFKQGIETVTSFIKSLERALRK